MSGRIVVWANCCMGELQFALTLLTYITPNRAKYLRVCTKAFLIKLTHTRKHFEAGNNI